MVQLVIDTPYVCLAEFARRTGQSVASVTTQADRGQIPIVNFTEEGKRGKRFVNMIALCEHASKAEFK